MDAKKSYVVIAGNIGVGKSSLTERLASALGWTPFFEASDENPYLADFYADMPRWSFHSQVFFLARRLQHHRQLIDHPGSVVQDRSIYEDAEVFACNLYQQGRLSARDYATYRALYDGISAFLPRPDLLIYLSASIPTLLQRIAARGRAFERNITPEYLTQLNTLYENWIEGWTACPVLTILTDQIDYVHASDDLTRLVNTVRMHLQEIAQNP